MQRMYSKEKLRRLRNGVPIEKLISEVLDMPTKVSEGYFRFLCPVCNEFVTATNPKTNLARCFRCERNFNPIDLVMVVKSLNFREAVEYLDTIVVANWLF
jgi:DNA primase